MARGRPKIDPARDRGILLDQVTRRSIAKACRQRPRSVTELEAALRRPGLKKMVDKMVSWGILEVISETPRGKPVVALTKDWVRDLEEAIGRNASVALVDQSFMVLISPELAPAAQCLARDHADDLSWVGVLGKREGLLIGVGGGEASRFAQIEKSLRASGVECELKPIGSTATGAEVAPFLRGFGAEGAASGS